MTKTLLAYLLIFTAFASFKASASACKNSLLPELNVAKILEQSKMTYFEDSIAIELLFNDQRRFNFVKRELTKRDSNMISKGFTGYSSNDGILKGLLGISQDGQGLIRFIATRDQLIEFRPFIEMANNLAIINIIGSDDVGVIRAIRTITEKVHPNDAAKWYQATLQKQKPVTIRITSTNNRKNFNRLLKTVQETEELFGYRVTDVFYNNAQSVGYFSMTGPPESFEYVLLKNADIHMFSFANR